MSEFNYKSIHSNRRGQTLIISLMIMFILSVVAGVFIAIVARNLARAQRFSNKDVVQQIAEAGIAYADRMLVYSEDGADWRPKPDNDGIDQTQPYNIVTSVMTAAADWTTQRDTYPDFKWTRAYSSTELGYAGPSGGFTTIKTGRGRFLLRVSYNPSLADPMSKNIKIESIGRYGIGLERDPSGVVDPTTVKPVVESNLRSEITAYKPIGITDYVRFVTNKDDRSQNFALGCAGYQADFGRSASDSITDSVGAKPPKPSKYLERGAPIRVNGNLLWMGDDGETINLYLRGVTQSGDNPILVPIDMAEVSGDVKFSADLNVEVRRMSISGSVIDALRTYPSVGPDTFTSAYGFYRDGSGLLDESLNSTTNLPVNLPRGIKRLEPPLVDQSDLTNTTTRYKVLTLNSGDITQAGNKDIGQYGWGRGVYINNTRDKQDESETLFGGYTLRNDWLNPNNRLSTYWKGNFYIPPGVVIILNPNDTDGDGQADFTMTRGDYSSTGVKNVWRDCTGKIRSDWGSTITMPYPDTVNGRTLTAVHGATADMHIDGNGVIYAEGNIRIRGMLPKNMQLTVVSNQTIYVEGNLLKYRDSKKNITDTDSWRGTGDETEQCSLALLARNYICVNTTQFMAPLNAIGADEIGSSSDTGDGPYHQIVTNDPASSPRFMFDFGPYESETANPAPEEWTLALRHAGQNGPAYINVWLNPSAAYQDWGVLYLNGANYGDLPATLWGVDDPNFNPAGAAESTFLGEVFDLTLANNAWMAWRPGMRDFLQIALDQSYYTREDYLLGGIAVQPMDIRIEAVMYAQEGSFFVIPGPWFNPNPADHADSDAPRAAVDRFPYYGQALDIKITIDGAISENISAAAADVRAWMEKWGRIPDVYGSSTVPTAHPGQGLTIIYDDHAGWPLYPLRVAATVPKPIRTDSIGRTLPFAPKLPVSASLIYTGDVR